MLSGFLPMTSLHHVMRSTVTVTVFMHGEYSDLIACVGLWDCAAVINWRSFLGQQRTSPDYTRTITAYETTTGRITASINDWIIPSFNTLKPTVTICILVQVGVQPSCVIFDIRALWRSGLSVRVPGCQKLRITA